LKLLVLAFACILLAPIPALAQTSQDDQYGGGSTTGDGFPAGPLSGNNAMHAATMASGAIRATSEESQVARGGSVSAIESSTAPSERDVAFAGEGVAGSSTEAQDGSASTSEAQSETASTSEAQSESASTAEAQDGSADIPGLEKLPQTGGPSPLWLFGAPLICIGGILARRILLA
jgi:hypothetical protein